MVQSSAWGLLSWRTDLALIVHRGMHTNAAIIETDIPSRLDRLPWTGFHTLVVIALGITWVLDGLEVTVAGSIAGALQDSPVLHFSPAEVGFVGSAYLAGAITGACRWLSAQRDGRWHQD